MNRFVVCYDVADDRRRNALARILDAYGDRIQESVFELPLGSELMEKCLDRIVQVINTEEDGLIVYALCASCDCKVQYFGESAQRPRIGEENVFIV